MRTEKEAEIIANGFSYDNAYPVKVEIPYNSGVKELYKMGLSKRELFASMAMQGILASDINGTIKIESIVSVSVVCADALIEELNKEK